MLTAVAPQADLGAAGGLIQQEPHPAVAAVKSKEHAEKHEGESCIDDPDPRILLDLQSRIKAVLEALHGYNKVPDTIAVELGLFHQDPGAGRLLMLPGRSNKESGAVVPDVFRVIHDHEAVLRSRDRDGLPKGHLKSTPFSGLQVVDLQHDI